MTSPPDMAAAWSAFWADHATAGCLPGAPPAVAAALAAVWQDLAGLLPPAARVVDLAAGNGAVLRTLRECRSDLQLIGYDYAEVRAEARALGVVGRVDIETLPVDRGHDAVVSQFGLEYCNAAAWRRAGELLAPGGHICLICHHPDSPVIAQGRRRLAAMQALESAGLLALAIDVARGRPLDARRQQAVNAAITAHRDQRIVTELPLAVEQSWRSRDPLAAVALLRRRFQAEQAMLSALCTLSVDRATIEARVQDLAATSLPLTVAVLAAQAQPIAWLVRNA